MVRMKYARCNSRQIRWIIGNVVFDEKKRSLIKLRTSKPLICVKNDAESTFLTAKFFLWIDCSTAAYSLPSKSIYFPRHYGIFLFIKNEFRRGIFNILIQYLNALKSLRRWKCCCISSKRFHRVIPRGTLTLIVFPSVSTPSEIFAFSPPDRPSSDNQVVESSWTSSDIFITRSDVY